MSGGTFNRIVRQYDVAAMYNQAAEHEWQRLELDAYHELEYLTTMHVLRQHLPSSGIILDAGGGPGRYALELCRTGHQVVLFDLSTALLEKAREQFSYEPAHVQERLLNCLQGDVRDLSAFPDGRFDITLCLGGPLSHIYDAAERRQAVSELVRVTAPGGLVCLGVIGYLAALRTLLWKYQGQHFLDDDYMQQLLDDGNGGCWHFFRTQEIRDLAESCGLFTVEMAGVQSLSTGLPEATNQLRQEPEKWQRWQELLLRYASEPAVVDMAGYMLYVGQVGVDE